jgi:hypothetical protein
VPVRPRCLRLPNSIRGRYRYLPRTMRSPPERSIVRQTVRMIEARLWAKPPDFFPSTAADVKESVILS